MFSYRLRALVVCVVGLGFLAGALACGEVPARKAKATSDGGDLLEEDFGYEDEQTEPETNVTSSSKDAGTITIPSRPSDGGVDVAKPASDGGACTGDIAPGDLNVVEIMVASKTGQGDTAEWVEIQSSRGCRLNVKGVKIASPRGTSGVDAVTVATDLELPPYGTFVVTGDADPLKNGGLPGPLVAWGTSDVLKNDGDTIEITNAAGAVIDKVTYPSTNPAVTPGVSIAFPANCSWSDRSSWVRWSQSPVTSTYGSASLKGTPNKDNTDVVCY
ncbi:MAG: lamin tail domain-containing protein [Myxococcales bacterium]|nr:lamin tail domain-containing protein [Myxococcales bacterium]